MADHHEQVGVLDAVVVVARRDQVDLDVGGDLDGRLVGLDEPRRGRPIGECEMMS